MAKQIENDEYALETVVVKIPIIDRDTNERIAYQLKEVGKETVERVLEKREAGGKVHPSWKNVKLAIDKEEAVYQKAKSKGRVLIDLEGNPLGKSEAKTVKLKPKADTPPATPPATGAGPVND